jgi:hypothetical protein
MLGNVITDVFGRPRPQRLNLPQAIVVVILLTSGLALWWYFRDLAQFPNSQRYIFGDRPRGTSLPAGLRDDIRSACGPQAAITLGYVLALGACAFLCSRLAVSPFGERFGQIARWAIIVAALANVIEIIGLRLGTSVAGDPYTGLNGFLTTATGAAETLKVCAFFVSALAVPAALVALGLRAWSRLQRSPHRQGASWWDDTWRDAELPDVTPESVSDAQWRWRNAYNVPGAESIRQRRDVVEAICLSGGGVRSACVAMGALQVFSTTPPASVVVNDPEWATKSRSPALVDCVDYIISVSGGGYTSGARLLGCQEFPADETDLAGEKPIATPASRVDPSRKLRLSERFEEGSVEFEHIRRHSSFIADSVPAMVRALVEVFKNLVASVLIVFWLPVAIGFLAGYLLAYLPVAAIVPVPRYWPGTKLQLSEFQIKWNPAYFPSLVHHAAAWWAVAVPIAVAVVASGVALSIELLQVGPTSERRRRHLRTAAQVAGVFAVAVLVVTVLLPAWMRFLSNLSLNGGSSHLGGTIGAILGLQYITAIVAMASKYRGRIPKQVGGGSWRDKLPRGVLPLLLVMLTLAVLAVAWLVVLGAVAAGVFGYLTQGVAGHLRPVAWLWAWLVVVIAPIIILSATDVTSLSLHPFYRNRLGSAFAVRRMVQRYWWGPGACEAKEYPDDEATWLHAYGGVEDGPQFVFAAAAAISGKGKPAPGLNAVSYTLSDQFIGGPDLGWLKTQELWKACPSRLKRDLTVKAAMAISGAAVASTMGRQNKGLQTLFALSGARLGTWLPNPNYVAILSDKTVERDPAPTSVMAELQGAPPRTPQRSWPLRSLPTVRGFTYFYRELFGVHPIDASLVQVTDGGHYENLGLVEALRRRCRRIICIDGGGDTPPLLSGLADAIRLAQAELGVKITLEENPDYGVGNLAPGSGKLPNDDKAFASLKPRLSRGCVARGKIVYPEASGLPADKRTGMLVFAKAVVWQGCPDWLLTYAAANEEFPHDPTTNQWFNEGQFAAYTALGRILGKKVVEALASAPDMK